MHELSLMASVMDIAREELSRHGASRLLLLRIRYGVLDQVQPDAMRMAFDSFVAGTAHEGACLELVEEPLQLGCRSCGEKFEAESREALFRPCPSCGRFAGFECLTGDGIFLDHLEAE